MHVVGIDSFTPYYDVALKEARLRELIAATAFVAERLDLADHGGDTRRCSSGIGPSASSIWRRSRAFAAPCRSASLRDVQRGRRSLNMLEACRHERRRSIWSTHPRVPSMARTANCRSREHDGADHPVSLYAATKKANEMMAHSYAHLFGLPVTGLRFFTVYGPWGRPDMAVYAFTRAIAEGCRSRWRMPAGSGAISPMWTTSSRAIVRLSTARRCDPDPSWTRTPDPATSAAPYRLYNIGNDRPEELNDLIALIEDALGRKANRSTMPLPPGDVLETRADVSDLRRDVGFAPSIRHSPRACAASSNGTGTITQPERWSRLAPQEAIKLAHAPCRAPRLGPVVCGARSSS